LRQGDILVGFAGRAVEGVDALHRALSEHPAGISIPVVLLRGVEKLELLLTPTEKTSSA
jgi:S1-C subfamily serine protease